MDVRVLVKERVHVSFERVPDTSVEPFAHLRWYVGRSMKQRMVGFDGWQSPDPSSSPPPHSRPSLRPFEAPPPQSLPLLSVRPPPFITFPSSPPSISCDLRTNVAEKKGAAHG